MMLRRLVFGVLVFGFSLTVLLLVILFGAWAPLMLVFYIPIGIIVIGMSVLLFSEVL